MHLFTPLLASNLCTHLYVLHAANFASALPQCDACPGLWLCVSNGGEHALATYAKEATVDVDTPRPSPSIPEAGSSIAAPFGARALATGAWFWAPRRSVLATAIAPAAQVAKSALSGAHSA